MFYVLLLLLGLRILAINWTING